MAYAERTTVAVEKSKAEIEKMITRIGAERYATLNEPGRQSIAFTVGNLHVRFDMPVPPKKDFESYDYDNGRGGRTKRAAAAAWKAWDQEVRRRWRALHLVIKAKLEAVETGITTFEQEFLAHIITKGGKTIGERVIPKIGEHVTKSMPLLGMSDQG